MEAVDWIARKWRRKNNKKIEKDFFENKKKCYIYINN